ncbi:MAG TPA: protein kinase [Gemmatimonadaceae bacterium]|nr:protein kinase [Gemmatimonadaceae bacterium]
MAALELDQLQAALGSAYQLERELGRGGMATVYLARDTKHGRRVALKVLHADLAATLGPERFQREISTAAQLQHPHVLGVYDSGTTATGQLWFTMPYIEGESLRDRLKRERQLPVDDAVRITREVADGLDYAHELGIIHRDIKPENILLTRRGDALLADFGIARALGGGDNTTLTATGVALGTPQYMSPEQATGERTIDARSDVYTLGAVCYEMLTGEPPFVGGSAQAVIAKMLSSEAPSPRLLRAGVTPAVDAVVRRALAPSPADRWPTAHAFSQALQQAAAPVAAPAPRRGVPAGAVLGLGFLIGVGVLFAWRSRVGREGAATGGLIRLAVLPFENLGDSADGYFADGVTDAVRAKLTGVPGLQVIGSSSSGQYRRTTKTPRQIGQELGVQYLLLGKVRWDKQTGKESEVQVSPELVEAGNAAEKWAQPFDAPLTHVFQVQGDIAGKVAQALQVALTPAAEKALATGPTSNLDAYDSYLRGRAFYDQGGAPPALHRSILAFSDAVQRDSTFALAWAALAASYGKLLFNTGGEHPGLADSADRASARALALAPNLAEAHAARAQYYGVVRRDNARAADEAQAGLAHGPNARLLAVLAGAEESLGQWDAAAQHAAQATAVDPREPATLLRVGDIALWRRHPAEAKAAVERVLALNPAGLDALERLAMTSLQLGDLAGARAALRDPRSTADDGSKAAYVANYWDLGWVLDSAMEARLLAVRPDAFDNDTAAWAMILAQQYRFRGDRARMLAYADTGLVIVTRRTAGRPSSEESRMFMALGLAYMGRGPEAIRMGEDVIHQPRTPDARNDPYFEFLMTRVYLAAGRRDRALDMLEQIMRAPFYVTPAWLRIDPNFAELHGDPRFERLVAGMVAPVA